MSARSRHEHQIKSFGEIWAREECKRRGIDPDELCADGGVEAWMVVAQETMPACPHDCYRPGDCDGSCTHPDPPTPEAEARPSSHDAGQVETSNPEMVPPAGERIRSTQDGSMEAGPVTGQSPVGPASPIAGQLEGGL